MNRENPREMPEISDRIVSYDPITLQRLPVNKANVIQEFLKLGNPRAAKIIAAIPDTNGILDSVAVDRLLIKVHCEMQRISEEFQHGQRASELLRPYVEAFRQHGVQKPLRIVDVGCGTGYVLRWLSAYAGLENVELIGVDYNEALVNEAQRLADMENLSCRFLVANAFLLKEPATLLLSSGVIHHFRSADLLDFFRQHNQSSIQGFLHFDFQPSPLAPFGSWLFHFIRMREPLAKHDGVLSAIRVHSAQTLKEAVKSEAPDFIASIYGAHLWGLPIPRVFYALVGIRPVYKNAFMEALGNRISRLGTFQ